MIHTQQTSIKTLYDTISNFMFPLTFLNVFAQAVLPTWNISDPWEIKTELKGKIYPCNKHIS